MSPKSKATANAIVREIKEFQGRDFTGKKTSDEKLIAFEYVDGIYEKFEEQAKHETHKPLSQEVYGEVTRQLEADGYHFA